MHVAFDMREESSDRAVTQAVTSQCVSAMTEFGNRFVIGLRRRAPQSRRRCDPRMPRQPWPRSREACLSRPQRALEADTAMGRLRGHIRARPRSRSPPARGHSLLCGNRGSFCEACD